MNVFPLLQPPPGYDSVVGEPGTILNYDESIGEFFRALTYIELMDSLAASIQGQ